MGSQSSWMNDWDASKGYGNDTYAASKKSKKGKKPYKRCFEDHPPLPLIDGLVIYGGSCIHSIVPDADLYIGFDSGMHLTERQYPWTDGAEIKFTIPDMGVPKNLKQFKKLVEYTVAELVAGKKVHAGCIGGHGRTGMFFAALVSVLMKEKDAIQYVRKNYCKKTVESEEQVAWLMKHFGVSKAEPTKAWSSGSHLSAPTSHGVQKPGSRQVTHVPSPSCIWGDN